MNDARRAGWLAAGLALVTVLLGVVAVLHGPVARPVFAVLPGGPVRIADLRVGDAVLIPPALVAVVAVIRARGRLAGGAVAWALGAASPIVLVLVARLNGIADAVAIVLVYAASGGAVLLRSLHRPGGDPRPLHWSAVLGIVPWGTVAFTQIGGLLTGSPPSGGVRVLTVVVLAAAVAEFVVAERRRDRPAPAAAGLALVALPAVLLAVLVPALVPG